ncbi:MAG TPA: nitronate monooxygenase, partial [Paracoccaceae bacterium]|nr:nitronate monooxygenase [Paracoccaceae bacterium]
LSARTRAFRARLGLRHPLLQAPMAGAATPALAAAVTQAGALGALGTATMALPALAAEVSALRALTLGGCNLNFFCHPDPQPDPARSAAMRAGLAPFLGDRALPSQDPPAPYPAFGPAHLDWLLAHPPRVASFHFGLPPPDQVARLRAAGIVVIATATSVAEARAVQASGADAVIAQGWEAGGHRGAFAVEPADAGVGLMALLPQVADAVDIPVIAAGGIADGRGIAAALVLGASAVQIGTAFLRCPEARLPEGHRRAVETASDTDTHLTRAYSGRPARARRTALGAALQDGPVTDYPLPRALTSALAGSPGGAADFWLYGQAAALARALPAGNLVARLVAETAAALRDLGQEAEAWTLD